jgi:hypothetical protein
LAPNGDHENNDGSDPQNPSAGYDNTDASDEIFMLRFDDDALSRWMITQVSNGPAGSISSNPVIGGYWFTRQCRSTSYQSDHDQLGNGSTGIHIYNYTKLSAETEQLSNAGEFGLSVNPAITGASSFAAVRSSSSSRMPTFSPTGPAASRSFATASSRSRRSSTPTDRSARAAIRP